ncbi:MAG: two-component system, OmpR family, phosphate regulon sensor histidine kinase PhoR [Thermomicrobiales bacterium]|nr:two-component system, OmpR family, phosphate regulon sensor histidine kinase PhoR [Thermomicrobiales bacterium]
MPETLRGRLALTYSVLTVVLVVALGAAIVASVRDFYVARLTDQLTDEARLTAAAITPTLRSGSDPSVVDPLVKQLGANLDGRITVIGADGRVLGDSKEDPGALPNQSTRPEVLGARRGDGNSAIGTSEDDASLAVAVIAPGSDVVVRISVPLDEINAAVGRVRRDVIGVAMIGAATAAAVAIFVSRRITRPLDALRQHASDVSAGHLDITTPPVAPRELGDLARSFNAMTARIRELVLDAERSRSRLEAIFGNLSDGVVIVDERGTVLGLNATASAMLGTNPVWAVGHPFVVAARDHDLVQLMQSSFEVGQARTATIEHTRGGHVLEATAQLVTGSEERFGIVVLRDITDLRRLESVRREFVANVSHELRTPLTSIRAVVETLEAGAIDDPAVAGDFLRSIVGEVDRLAALVDELLDLARIESGRLALKFETITPADLIVRGAERLRPQIERARLELVIDVPSELPPVLADRARIEQVLINLIHNAIKFTPPEGKITVAAKVEGGMIQVSVDDTGVGIPEAELPRVFERFYKTDRARRSEGTGLGLAIAKHIVQGHRGTISVTSQPGRGARFVFTLPLALVAAEPRQVARSGVTATI